MRFSRNPLEISALLSKHVRIRCLSPATMQPMHFIHFVHCNHDFGQIGFLTYWLTYMHLSQFAHSHWNETILSLVLYLFFEGLSERVSGENDQRGADGDGDGKAEGVKRHKCNVLLAISLTFRLSFPFVPRRKKSHPRSLACLDRYGCFFTRASRTLFPRRLVFTFSSWLGEGNELSWSSVYPTPMWWY